MLKFKQKGTLILKRGDLYYLYRVSSKWNSQKKRVQLKTGEYIGRITPDGIIEPKTKRIMKRYDHISVKEYGSSLMLQHISSDLISALKLYFPEWKEVFIFACMRLVYNSPMKNVDFYNRTSYLSETIGNAHLSADVLGDMLRKIGADRKAMKDFMQ